MWSCENLARRSLWIKMLEVPQSCARLIDGVTHAYEFTGICMHDQPVHLPNTLRGTSNTLQWLNKVEHCLSVLLGVESCNTLRVAVWCSQTDGPYTCWCKAGTQND
jgi:hypothetical protein